MFSISYYLCIQHLTYFQSWLEIPLSKISFCVPAWSNYHLCIINMKKFICMYTVFGCKMKFKIENRKNKCHVSRNSIYYLQLLKQLIIPSFHTTSCTWSYSYTTIHFVKLLHVKLSLTIWAKKRRRKKNKFLLKSWLVIERVEKKSEVQETGNGMKMNMQAKQGRQRQKVIFTSETKLLLFLPLFTIFICSSYLHLPYCTYYYISKFTTVNFCIPRNA
jgi:hypothetical protein